MKRNLMVFLAVALLLVPVAPLALGDATITVETGLDYYNPGDSVAVTGVAPANATVHLSIRYSNSSVFAADVAANATTGAFSATYTLHANASLGVYTVTASTATLEAETVFTVTTTTAAMAQQLMSAASNAKTFAQETIQEVIAGGYALPESVNASMSLGTAKLAEAAAHYAVGNYPAAAEAARSAMEQFKSAIIQAIRAGDVDEPEDDLNATLRFQIERLQKEALRISEVLTRLSEGGNNVTAIEAKVATANASLTSAAALVNAGNLVNATTALKAAREDLRDAMSLLKGLYMQVRRSLMLEYKNTLRECLNATRGDLGKLKDYIASANLTAAFRNFGSVESYIKRCEERLDADDDDGAIDDLEEASRQFGNGLGALDSDGFASGMRNTNSIRAHIQALEQQEASLLRRGKDTSAIEGQIAGLQSLLDEGMSMMQNGNAYGANKVFENYGHMDGGHGRGRGK